MESEELSMERVHHGLNIRRARRLKGIKQMALADDMELSQQAISHYEAMDEIEEPMLKKFAKALDVPLEFLKMKTEEASQVVFENNTITNTYNDSDGAVNNISSVGAGSSENDHDNSKIFNPVEKLVELYERLLTEEKEKNAALEQRLVALENKSEK